MLPCIAFQLPLVIHFWVKAKGVGHFRLAAKRARRHLEKDVWRMTVSVGEILPNLGLIDHNPCGVLGRPYKKDIGSVRSPNTWATALFMRLLGPLCRRKQCTARRRGPLIDLLHSDSERKNRVSRTPGDLPAAGLGEDQRRGDEADVPVTELAIWDPSRNTLISTV
jgi:hypothetical protein